MSMQPGSGYHYYSDGTPASDGNKAMVEKTADPPMGQGWSDGDTDGPEGGGDQDVPDNGGAGVNPFSFSGGGQGDAGNAAIVSETADPPMGVGNSDV